MAMAPAFHSKSLIYRATEDNEEDKVFMHSLWLDPQSMYQNHYTQLHKPLNRKSCDSYSASKESFRLINLVICLPIDSEGFSYSPKKQVPIGFVNLHGVTPDNQHHRTLDIGILIAAEHQGKGYGSEAVRWILNWGFQTAGLHRVGLQTASFNTRAIRLWKRLGFQEDGKDREALWANGSWHDEVRFSMLEGEWRSMVERESRESDSVMARKSQGNGIPDDC
jgi:RimJ/RimL family protein N-acetyltransferase